MDTTKAYFIQRANKYGILLVRERNPAEDLTGWGALEFILNNGEIFVISGYPFGQGEGEDGLWVDMNALDEAYFEQLKAKIPPRTPSPIDIQQSAEDWLISEVERLDL
jgi:hypothetical protein